MKKFFVFLSLVLLVVVGCKQEQTTPTPYSHPMLMSGPPIGPSGVYYIDGPQLDPFSRVRVSEPTALLSSKLTIDAQPLVWDDQQVSGGSTTSTYNTNQASDTLLVTGNVAGVRARQTFQNFSYQAGKGQLVTLTGVLNTSNNLLTGVTRNLGLYDTNNGFYFSQTATALNVCVRTNTSGSPVNTCTAQSSWNIDKFDGTGPSGITIDMTKVQIFVIDFQWLGVGRIRFGFDVNGQLYYADQILIANNQSLVSVSTPTLPVKYEAISLGTGTSATATMTQICAAIVSEGGSNVIGSTFAANTGTTQLTGGNNTNIYPLLAFQFASGKSHTGIQWGEFSVASTTASANFFVMFILNPTIAGTALSYNTITNSSLQYAVGTGATTLSGGTILYSGYFLTNHAGTSLSSFPTARGLGISINGTSDTIILAVQAVPSGIQAYSGSMNWVESY